MEFGTRQAPAHKYARMIMSTTSMTMGETARVTRCRLWGSQKSLSVGTCGRPGSETSTVRCRRSPNCCTSTNAEHPWHSRGLLLV